MYKIKIIGDKWELYPLLERREYVAHARYKELVIKASLVNKEKQATRIALDDTITEEQAVQLANILSRLYNKPLKADFNVIHKNIWNTERGANGK